MAFIFEHDGRVYRLDTEGGQVHCAEVPQPAAPAQPLEPSDDDQQG